VIFGPEEKNGGEQNGAQQALHQHMGHKAHDGRQSETSNDRRMFPQVNDYVFSLKPTPANCQ